MNSRNLAKTGMIVALTEVILMLTSVFPTLKISILAVTTIIGGIIYLKFGLKSALTIYAAVSILAFFLVGSKFVFVLYLIFFGNYAIVKALIEKSDNLQLQWVLKIITAVLYSLIILLLLKLFGSITEISSVVFIVVFIGAFIIFDIVLSVVFNELMSKFKFWERL